LKKIQQQLVEVWQSNNTAFEWKRSDFGVSVFAR